VSPTYAASRPAELSLDRFFFLDWWISLFALNKLEKLAVMALSSTFTSLSANKGPQATPND
jgi:hypothetical protein